MRIVPERGGSAGVPALMLLAFVVLAALHLAAPAAYLAILRAINETPFPHPFLDTRFVTAQVECWRAGVDVYATNPCDPLGRTHDYSPLWLRLTPLGQSDRWTPVFGLATDAIFLASLFFLPWRRGNAFGTVVAVAATLSWASFFALERGNTDLLMFAAIVAFARLAAGGARGRDAGTALVLGAGLLKFYPLVLLGLLVRESWRRMIAGGLFCAVVLLAFAVGFHAELARIGQNMATGVFGGMFGARTIPYGLVDLWRMGQGLPVNDAVPPGWPGTVLLAAMTAGCLAQAVALGRRPAFAAAFARLDPLTRSTLLAGAVLVAGCFFGHQNIGYRSVMLLLVVPGLLALPARLTAAMVVIAMWAGDLGGTGPGWLLTQLAWWWIVTTLLAVVVAELGPELVRKAGVRGEPSLPGLPLFRRCP